MALQMEIIKIPGTAAYENNIRIHFKLYICNYICMMVMIVPQGNYSGAVTAIDQMNNLLYILLKYWICMIVSSSN